MGFYALGLEIITAVHIARLRCAVSSPFHRPQNRLPYKCAPILTHGVQPPCRCYLCLQQEKG